MSSFPIEASPEQPSRGSCHNCRYDSRTTLCTHPDQDGVGVWTYPLDQDCPGWAAREDKPAALTAKREEDAS